MSIPWDEALDNLYTQVDGRLQLTSCLPQYICPYPVYLAATRIIVADARTQAGIVLTDKLLDVPIRYGRRCCRLPSVGRHPGQGWLIADNSSRLWSIFPDSAISHTAATISGFLNVVGLTGKSFFP